MSNLIKQAVTYFSYLWIIYACAWLVLSTLSITWFLLNADTVAGGKTVSYTYLRIAYDILMVILKGYWYVPLASLITFLWVEKN